MPNLFLTRLRAGGEAAIDPETILDCMNAATIRCWPLQKDKIDSLDSLVVINSPSASTSVVGAAVRREGAQNRPPKLAVARPRSCLTKEERTEQTNTS